MFSGKVEGGDVFSANLSGILRSALLYIASGCFKKYLGLSFDFASLEPVSALGIFVF